MTFFLTLKLEDETATAELARKVSRQLQAGDVVFLSGDLGAGKTTFTRHLISAFGLNTKVKSPTYTLLETYDLPETAPAKTLHHFDLYRLTDPREWYSAGFDESINDAAIIVIEWAEKAEGALPKPDWRIHLTHDEPKDIEDDNTQTEPCAYFDVARFVVIEAVSERAGKRIGALKAL
ncbi:MAG: tRNA (adenosine(37)-N6)-threonylcarbamoyltransferase complex ATPase subunit type 1 TsaE [Burkholderiales bacterium]|jgi:tRNA threonylcarbamoyladenosine biosynthesis protein TsaE|nr:tRNA (adenosine(37)-N6)-threonylcarbamoyltransferase complex ATPase subunit type 1 TsaE [Burkholderiales bacterium]MCE1177089.1 tRNA (adenosine(37)-N6)-threonylcarbamoyltransferase complex ATPase subunit type 1 TsaE [Burkholderiales bacterium]